MGLALVFLVLLTACGGGGAEDVPPAPQEVIEEEPTAASALELEETDWPVVSIDAGAFGISDEPIGDPGIYGGAASLPLDQLVAFALASDGAAAEDLHDELRQRFVEAPNAVLAYLTLIGDQQDDYWERPAAEVICESIACADAAWYNSSEAFTQTMAACRERYPTGRISELLDVMEREHAASMERNHGQNQ